MLHQDGANKKEKMKTKGVDVKDGLRDGVEDAVHEVGSATGCTVSIFPCSSAWPLEAQRLPCRASLPEPERLELC